MTCAFVPCEDATECALVDGCWKVRGFVQLVASIRQTDLEAEGLKADARALAGTKPARTDKHPSTFKRDRKELTR